MFLVSYWNVDIHGAKLKILRRFKIRRTFVAAILHLQGFKEGHLGSDDVDMMEFKSALQKADAEFQVCPSLLLAHFLPTQARLPKWEFDPADLIKIRLHRIWTSSDAENVRVYKFPVQSLWNKVSTAAGDSRVLLV